MRRFIALVAGLAAGLLACSPQLEIPAGAEILCEADGRCPAGRVCGQSGRCLDPALLDVEPPLLDGPPGVSPAVGRIGTVFSVVLETNKPLLRPPDVTASFGGATFDCEEDAPRRYRCGYEATGTENDGLGGELPFDVALRDAAGHVTRLHQAGLLRLDFQPPALAAASVEPAESRLGTRVQVFFAASEPVLDPVVIQSSVPLDRGGEAGDTFEAQRIPGTANYVFEHVVTEADEATTVTFTVDLTDLSGNVGAGLVIGQTTIDNRVPEVVEAAVSHAFIRPGEPLEVTFEVSKPLAGDPVVTHGEYALVRDPSVTEPAYRYTRTIGSAEAEGPFPVLISGRDGAGNELFASLGVVTVDATPPAVVGGTGTVVLVPAAQNLLPVVERATSGTAVRTAFSLDEPVVGDPAVWAEGPAVLPFARQGGGSAPAYERVISAEDPEGVYTLHVQAIDRAGNVGTSAIDGLTFEVHHTPPPPPAVDEPEAFVHVRTPFGAAGSGGVPAFALRVGEGAVAPGDTLLILDGPDHETAVELGRARPEDWGPFETALSRTDRADLFLILIDDAGNASGSAQVQEGEWTATLGRKRAGSLLENPTTLLTTSRFRSTLQQDPLRTNEPDPADLALPGGGTIARRVEAAWRRWTHSAETPGYRSGYGAFYDAGRGQAILFGGRDEYLTTLRDTWRWDSDSGHWSSLQTDGAPSARQDFAMTFDASRESGVLYGGRINAQVSNELWTYDPATSRWTSVAYGSEDAPGPRWRHAMAFDSFRGRVVLHGGSTAFGGVGDADVYEWDGTRWWRRSAPGPEARRGASMAFDPLRNRMILFGGILEGVRQNDLWEWDGEAGTWTEHSPSLRPPPRADAAMAWDPIHERMVLVGGSDGSRFQDVWTWDPGTSTWTEHPGDVPPGRTGHRLVFDVVRGRMLLFGDVMNRDIWEWDGDTWRDRTPSDQRPSPRSGAALAATEAGLLLFGGWDSGGPVADTWLWDGAMRRWREVASDGPVPSPRGGHVLASTPAGDLTFLFGGGTSPVGFGDRYDDVWVFDGEGWEDVSPPAGPRPSGRQFPGWAWAGAGRLVLLGGSTTFGTMLEDTWSFDSHQNTWQAEASFPWTPYLEPALVRDAHEEEVLALVPHWASSGHRIRAYRWDAQPGVWSELGSSTGAPPARDAFGAVYDAGRGRVTLFGGLDINSNLDLDDLWQLDAASAQWSETTDPVTGPSPRRGHAMAYDGVRGESVVFSGLSGEVPLDETWILDGGAHSRPAAIWRIPLDGLGLSDSSVQSLEIRAVAGGRGHVFAPSPSAVDGIALQAWDGAGWRPLVAVTSPPVTGGPQLVALEWDDATEGPAGEGLFVGASRALNLALVPVAPAGADPDGGIVEVDYLEVTVRYRRF